ncbi:uncharacterized protein UV8b_00563 [Ustilaginoidea virens]|uniref:C2H2-type domain-containing protein n=1 Tax=Ustilaginoidea virens TaxID=1159556 RepID=A0A8E5ME75_USTVR|nr:uncharacterized protein UV8b_00563 [Ustilaginoidea virens]QUC16322.1 hypothetical protein UV8b_00563 [Ustilaginoidea virens]
MAFPPQYRETPPSLPSILSAGPGHYRRHHDMAFSGSPAISIPGLDTKDDVPPPLPPPRHPFLDSAHAEDSSKGVRELGHFVPSIGSGYGSMCSSVADERPRVKRRDTASSNNADEGYASYTAAERIRESRPTEFLHHSKFHFQTAADLHGDSMKKKLDPIRTIERSPRSMNVSALSEQVRRHGDPRLTTLSMPVQLPIHSRSAVDSPVRLSDTAVFSAVSPRRATFRHFAADSWFPKDGSDYDRSPRSRSHRNNSDDASIYGGHEFSGADDMEIDEATSPKRLQADEAYAMTGHKRRAASPLAGSHVPQVSGSTDARRRDLGSRGSPTLRLTVVPQASSVSSMSSAAISRSNSYISTMSITPCSATTAQSFGRRSPIPNSPGGISPSSCNSPYATPASLNQSPRNSISGRANAHGRTVSGSSPRKMSEMQKPTGSKVQHVYMCECCPKKPKKFQTAGELSAHEAEKQYECSFCGNRFKNKNEAERHQNSLHVRRHSWSCSALSGYDRAFHDSTSQPGEADTCGYCGNEFSRSGKGPGTGALSGGIVPKHATYQDWDERIRHLREVHKFRECNSSKKFYRADHFRQHLKHSHAGSSGKWTNMLENACMLEEDAAPR